TRCVTRITRSLESANARTEDRESNEAVRRFAAAEGNGSRYCARPSSFKRSINLDSKAAISCNRCLKDFLLNLCYGQGANWLHILGVEFMKNVVEFRAQATTVSTTCNVRAKEQQSLAGGSGEVVAPRAG